MGKTEFQWSKQLNYNQANSFVQWAAHFLGLPHGQNHANSFTTKSVRQGKAATTYVLMKEFLAATNPNVGRATGSLMDPVVYCPESVKVMPGPLYSNIDMAKATLDSALVAYFGPLKCKLLCKACGMPQCDCEQCSILKKGGLHTCWLECLNGKVGKRSKNSIPMSDQQFAAMTAAWASIGIADVPLFQNGKFTFE